MSEIILLTSDWHKTPFAKEKFQSQKKSLGELFIQLMGYLFGGDRVIQRMKNVIRMMTVDMVIHNGDLQENTYNEQGITTEDDFQSTCSVINEFEEQVGVQVVLNMGNHESGYHPKTLPLATDPKGGASQLSIQNFLRLTSRKKLYHSFELEGYRFVLIPYLLTEECGKDFDIDRIKREILDDFSADLQNSSTGKIILLMHDPDSLINQEFLQLIRENREKIALIFCGHLHAQLSLFVNRWLVRIFSWWWLMPLRLLLRIALTIIFDARISRDLQQYFRKRKDVPRLIKQLEIKIIPAPGGMLGLGGGFLLLDLEDLSITKC